MILLFNVLFSFLFFLSNYCTFILADNYHNTLLNESSGLFYNNLGETKISHSKLTLLSHINLTQLNHAHSIAKYFYKSSNNLCTLALKDPSKHNHVSFHCERTLKLIEEQLFEITNKNQILHHIVGNKLESRKRRGLINGISYALKWLFGTPSSADAQYYSDSIQYLINNNKQTETLIKSQIQIISSTIKNFNNSVMSLKQNEDEMNKNIEFINQFASQTNNAIDNLRLESVITQQIMTLLSVTNKISNEFDKYIDAVNLGKHGILSPQIITPKILFDELNSYHGIYDLPVIIDEHKVHIYYKLLELQIFSINDLIIFAIKIPLVDKLNYNLYQLIPLPIQHSNTSIFSFIQPRQEFLLISMSKTYFTLLQDLNTCIEYEEQKFICKEISTNKRTDRITCETQLLSSHMKTIPEDCSTKYIKASIETWKYVKYNQWIYVLQKPITLTIICDDKPSVIEDVLLHQTGIINLKPLCKGYTDMFVLETTSNEEKNVTHLIPSIDITEDDCCMFDLTLEKMNSINLKPIKMTNIDLNELRYANKKLQEFDEIVTNQMNKPFIISHTTWYTSFLAMIGGVVLLLVCINLCNWCGCGKLLKRLCCVTRNPRNGEVLPPIIKNFVNCTFDSELHTDSHNSVRDTYSRPREAVQMASMSASESDPLENINIPSPIPQSRFRIQGRRSTTPL